MSVTMATRPTNHMILSHAPIGTILSYSLLQTWRKRFNRVSEIHLVFSTNY